ncbi:ankyrin repeat-containing domain protein [Neocallimastix sp. 'constans']
MTEFLNLKKKKEKKSQACSFLIHLSKLAVQERDIDLLSYLSSKYYNNNYKMSMRRKQYQFLKYLLDYGLKDDHDFSFSDSKGKRRKRLLMKVCEDNNLEILQLFVGYGVDMNSHNALDDTPLMVACEHGYLDMVKYFIEIHCDHGVNINYKSEEVGEARSKLLKEILSQKEDLTMLNYLLRQGFKLTEEDHNLWEDINISLNITLPSILKMMTNQLIDYGIDIKKELEDGKIRMVDLSMINRNEKFAETIKYIFSHNKNTFSQEDYVDLIKRFTQIGEVELVKILSQWLIENGADINLKSNSESPYPHQSPLEVTCHHNNTDMIKKNNRNNNRNNLNEVLLESYLKENMVMIRTFLHQQQLENSQAFNINCIDKYGRTALKMVKLLVENGADVNIFNRNKYTALMTSFRDESAAHIAYHYENFEIVQYLIDQGFDINSQLKYGTSQLIMACEKGHLINVHYFFSKGADKIVEALIQQGATTSINFINKLGETALQIAFTNKFIGLATYLKSQGAQ